ncbi:MAG: hypothetical protein M1819_003826 [Sarea resinae]|nr:MAG: hypothetical protein M1819_003826 [Sarea resinae]
MAERPSPPLPVEGTEIPPSELLTIQYLQDNSSLWYRIHVFLYDLRHFDSKVESQSRLERVVDASYLGLPYFQPEEVAQLKATTVNIREQKTLETLIQETLDERLNRRMKKRVESRDFRVCAAHDMAPIMEKAFDIKPKDLERNEEFITMMEENGLNLEDEQGWLQVSKKGYKEKKGGRRRR